MGCTGSSAASVYAEDGSVIAGKGDSKIEWDSSKPMNVAYYYYNEASDVKMSIKDFPADESCVKKLFEETRVSKGSAPGIFWAEVIPGNRYAMKYTEGGHPLPFPGAATLEIPRKAFEFHSKDDAAKDKFVKDLVKEVEKDKEAEYTKAGEGAEAMAKADFEKMGTVNGVDEVSENMKVYKKAMQTAENLQPYNNLVPGFNLWTEFGNWDEKDGKLGRQLGLKEKVAIKAEEEIRKRPAEGFKLLSKKGEVLKTVISKAVEGACKKVGPEPKDLVPMMEPRLDAADNCVPDVARRAEYGVAPKEGEEKKEEEKKEGDETDPLEEAAKAQYAKDKGQIDAWKSADSADKKGAVEAALKAAFEAGQPIEPSANADKLVSVNYKEYFGPCFVNSVSGETANVTFPATIYQAETSLDVPTKVEVTKIEGGKATTSKVSAFSEIPPSPEEFIQRGRAVRAKEGRELVDGWISAVDGDNVTVKDGLDIAHVVKKSDVYIFPSSNAVATRGLAIIPNFASVEFWWVVPEDPAEAQVTRVLRLWRFGARDETLEEIPLQIRKQKAKPTKENENPTHEVCVGYAAKAKLLGGRHYCYNFKVGEDTYLDFETKAASDKAHKTIIANFRCEY